MRKKDSKQAIYGDFQTPLDLALNVCRIIKDAGVFPSVVIEPSCGEGNFLFAASTIFPDVDSIIGVEINEKYIQRARSRVNATADQVQPVVIQDDFFTTDWKRLFANCTDPILIVGNPPWVTNAEISHLGGQNLPEKRNVDNLRGFDARTGKSNFDISEWMIRQYLDWISDRKASIGILCKTAVARKILAFIWEKNLPFGNSEIFKIDALRHFKASVDACLFIIHSQLESVLSCKVYEGLSRDCKNHSFGFQDVLLISNIEQWQAIRHLLGRCQYRWRSGIKHDCSGVMEFTISQRSVQNNKGEWVDIESELLYPLIKSSDLSNGKSDKTSRRILITQKSIDENTDIIEKSFPKTWEYLLKWGQLLDQRKSSVYRSRPRFSIFGVGDYAFYPWKIGISALYKNLSFKKIGTLDNKPIMLDDTCYYIACESEAESELLCELLNSPVAKTFYESLIFWDNKRAINIEILSKLDIRKLAAELGKESELISYIRSRRKMRSAMALMPQQDHLILE